MHIPPPVQQIPPPVQQQVSTKLKQIEKLTVPTNADSKVILIVAQGLVKAWEHDIQEVSSLRERSATKMGESLKSMRAAPSFLQHHETSGLVALMAMKRVGEVLGAIQVIDECNHRETKLNNGVIESLDKLVVLQHHIKIKELAKQMLAEMSSSNVHYSDMEKIILIATLLKMQALQKNA